MDTKKIDYSTIYFCSKCKCFIKGCSYYYHLISKKHNINKRKLFVNENNKYLINFS